MKQSIPDSIRPAPRHCLALILAAILFLLPFSQDIAGDAAEDRIDDCTTIVIIVDGMMKSLSGAT